MVNLEKSSWFATMVLILVSVILGAVLLFLWLIVLPIAP